MVSICVIGLTNALACGQAFERCMQLASALQELNTSFDRTQESGQQIARSLEDMPRRMQESDRLVESMQMQKLIGEKNATQKWSQYTLHAASLANLPAEQESHRLQAYAQIRLGLSVETELLVNHARNLDQASRQALQQRLLLIDQLKSLFRESEEHLAAQLELIDRYWQLAGVAGERSDWELQAALRALERTTQDNLGANLAAGIILTRMGRLDEAQTMLKRLESVPVLRPIMLVAQAEVMVRAGKRDEASTALRDAFKLGKTDARVRVHRAVVLALLGEFREAYSEWSSVLKLGSYDIAARRSMALVLLAGKNPTEQQKAAALENAQLAVRLGGDADWLSHVALALAQAAHGQVDQAVASANEAAELTIGSTRLKCLDLAVRLKAGEQPKW